MDLRWLTESDADVVAQAGHLFDDEVRPGATRRFLTRPGHHLCLAYLDGRPVGFVTGVEVTHPDKGTEMFLYELGVDEAARGQGIGTALVTALSLRARTLGCYGMWVLTEADNAAALATYAAAGASERDDAVMLTWHLDPSPRPRDDVRRWGPGQRRG